jgi:hypothetical protein
MPAPHPTRRAAADNLGKWAADGSLRQHGFAFSRGTEPLEADAKLLHRFLCDTGLSGGAWLHVPPAGSGSGGGSGGGGFVEVPERERVSTCDLEVAAPWGAVECLTPDATELAEPDWKPQVGWSDAVLERSGCMSPRQRLRQPLKGGQSNWACQQLNVLVSIPSPRPQVLRRLGAAAPAYLQAAARAAAAGAIPALKVMALDVVAAPADGAVRSVNAVKDPVICIATEVREVRLGSHGGDAGSERAPAGPVDGDEAGGGGGRVVFLLAQPPGGGARVPPAGFEAEGAMLRVFATVSGGRGSDLDGRDRCAALQLVRAWLPLQPCGAPTARAPPPLPQEASLLEAWRDHVRACDVDAFVLFQVLKRWRAQPLCPRLGCVTEAEAAHSCQSGLPPRHQRPPTPTPPRCATRSVRSRRASRRCASTVAGCTCAACSAPAHGRWRSRASCSVSGGGRVGGSAPAALQRSRRGS